jgi:serine/threonine protein phosphatase PrpC
MLTVKDTQRATVQVCFDGSVRKAFHGPKAQERFENELFVLRYLEKSGCDFVPRVISADLEKLLLVTTNCGSRVDRLDEERCRELFAELEGFGVRHDDPELRNVTYRQQDGRFCLIDFEFATILQKEELPISTPEKFPSPKLSLTWSGCSDKGPSRAKNEDAFMGLAIDEAEVRHLGKIGASSNADADLLFAVSDGMGGANAGEFASRITIEKITRMFPPLIRQRASGTPIGYEGAFASLFSEINKALQYLGDSYEECRGMGATLSLCWFSEEMMHFAHIGDTRIYHLSKDDTITQLTKDDSHVAWLRRTGQISELEARMHPAKNRLHKALGAGNQFVNPQIGEITCSSGDRFLICSDGITDGLSDARITEALKKCPKGIDPAEHLVSVAVASSGKDNATAVIVAIS